MTNGEIITEAYDYLTYLAENCTDIIGFIAFQNEEKRIEKELLDHAETIECDLDKEIFIFQVKTIIDQCEYIIEEKGYLPCVN